jgi:ankyrin repeat protein
MNRTDLYIAALVGNAERVKELLKKGENPNIKNKDDRTPLHKAASGGYVDVLKLLLERGADPTVKNKYGYTPLDLAKVRGHREVVSLIEKFHIEGWLGRGGEPSRPPTQTARALRPAVREACCEAWHIIDQVTTL